MHVQERLIVAAVAWMGLVAGSTLPSAADIKPSPLVATWGMTHRFGSLASLGREEFAFTDYQDLYYWKQGFDPIVLGVVVREGARIDSVWNPTGVYQHDGDIYVANYTGRNVLIGRLSPDGKRLEVHTEMRDPDMVSPEGVFADDDYIAVTDYDASGVFLFNKRGDLLWKRLGLSLAHGVTISDGFVYVTCLGNQKLLKLDMHGNIVAENNTSGWNDLLYPTSIQPTGHTGFGGAVAVIDANRGAIAIYDQELRKIREIGRNAPDMFKRPYGFVIVGDRFLVADSSNHRLVWLSGDGKIEGQPFGFEPVVNIGTAPRWGHGYAYCSYDEVPSSIGIQGYRLYTGFATFCLYRDDVLQGQMLLPYSRLDGSGLRKRPINGFTFAWHASVERHGQIYDVIGSFDRSIYMVQHGAKYVFVDGPADISVWGSAGAETILSSVVELAQPEFGALEQVSQQCSDLFAFFHYGRLIRTSPEESLLEALFTPEAKVVARAWIDGTPVTVQAGELINKGPISLDDLTIMTLIARTNANRERGVWRQCAPEFNHGMQ